MSEAAEPPSIEAAIQAGWTAAFLSYGACAAVRTRPLESFPAASRALPAEDFVEKLKCAVCGLRSTSLTLWRGEPIKGSEMEQE